MRKIIPLLVVLLFLGGAAYLLTMPLNAPSAIKTEASQKVIQTNTNGAFKDYKTWQKSKKHSGRTIQAKLKSLEKKHPQDYRFSLERVRGEKNIESHAAPSRALDLLATAAKKAIKSSDTNKMLNDLKKNQTNKRKGFKELAKHKRQWNRVLRSLENKDAGQLRP